METSIIQTLESISPEVLNGVNSNARDFARKILNYPAMMVPSVQEPIIKSLSETFEGEISLIDPFMGASNTLVTGMKYGLNVFGQDINPLSVLLSKVKTTYYSKEELIASQLEILIRLESDSSRKKERRFHNIDKWFREDVQIELSRLYRAINQESNLKIRQFFWITLAEVIRLTSNDRTSTFKMHVRPKEEIAGRNLSPISYFSSILKRSIDDVIDYCSILEKKKLISNGSYVKNTEVKWGNSLNEINTEQTFDLLVTSPPYGDNQTTVTYGQFSYLPLQWIPMEDIEENIEFDYLKTIQQIDTSSLGGKMITNFSERKAVLFEKSITLKQLFDDYDEDEKRKAKKVVNFVYDLDKTIDNLLSKIKSGAYMVWTVGNRNVNKKVVQNDSILIDLLSSKKIELVTDLERDILSKRMPGRNNFSDTMNKEKILIFKTSSANE